MYIYPITDPKILKLGIRMALYREKKPDLMKKAMYSHEDNGEVWVKTPEYNLWQQSFIAYLKEPEFKAKDIAYKNGIKYKITLIKKTSESSICMSVGSGLRVEINLKDLSHYYEGQEVESFKYVRRIEFEEDEGAVMASIELIEWQEVEQPAEEEKVYIDDEDIEKGYAPDFIFTNDEYTQFQEDKKSGVILLEI